MKKVLIVSLDKFPDGNAGATRQRILSELILENNPEAQITHLGFGESTNFEYIRYKKNIKYLSMKRKYIKSTKISNIISYFLFRLNLKKLLKKENYNFDTFIVISIPLLSLMFLKKVALKKNINLIHDSVEWYSSSEFNLGKLNYFYLEKDIMNRFLIDKNFKVISISNYLNKYFRSKGIRSVRIPFILDVKRITSNKNVEENKITFMYAGMLGKKDLLLNFFEAFSLLSEDARKKCRIIIFGPSLKEMIETKNLDEMLYKKIKKQLEIKGRVPRNEVTKQMEKVDFTILFRPEYERYAKAGFPTKVVESMSYSTPVFCNISSDLKEYLVDGSNSIISESTETEKILEGLKKIVNLDYKQRLSMQNNARETALEKFDFSNYSKELEELEI
ncbi:glycosyltransferase [Exiguobacterium sp. UBA4551]|uniref:glycosyltransferase n=1 Tax=Exiguobacterium sp. UBA4551 TaxID=1946494 RepID=UPI002579AF35|nr:glycosyltransferase [Exiguobacterium sp. UBA4551]